MVSTFTPNIQLEEPARGDQVGVWDTPVNGNSVVLDRTIGAITTISLNNSPVVLASAQYQSKTLIFNSTLTGNVTITFPTSFTKSYEVLNGCTGIQFTITLATTAAAGQAIALPPGDMIECYNDGTNIKFKNFDRVGTYWDYCGSSVPNWVSGCSVPPYLNCDASPISSSVYPVLFAIIGNTLPDARGRGRFTLNQGIGRITAGISGIDGNTLLSGGGNQSLTAHTHLITDPLHQHLINNGSPTYMGQGFADVPTPTAGGAVIRIPIQSLDVHTTGVAATGITIVSQGLGASQNMPPGYMGGLTLIRAA